MIRVLGTWEFGWNTPIKEVDLWEFPLREFGVEEFYMCPVSGIKHSYVKEIQDMQILIESSRKDGFVPVFCDEKGKQELKMFEHPKDCIYIFGKNYMNSLYLAEVSDISLKVETKLKTGMLWPHQAASIILYDRFIKTN